MVAINRTGRNLVFGALLWAMGTTAFPAQTSANFCTPALFQNWTGRCAGAMDACMYFTAECEYLCFWSYYGNLCSAGLLWCEQQNNGSEEWPNYCLTNGWCKCDVYSPE
jgi:hypothetical protein